MQFVYSDAEAGALADGLGLSMPVPESGTTASVPSLLLLLLLHAVAPNSSAMLIVAVISSVIHFLLFIADFMAEVPSLFT
ncbi:hypothetical protein [Cohnella silvisoli]|uniref:Uncharacterized protein n=1 Tax=Cohnella silvisoli TaxID=2873699 RepID=A0ABV1KQ17_9BACL|nr:hypothetical protein [Cohnella silvisoli]MCD9022168.1 hypothetical protein [Cohnella silvisoli]